MWLDALKCINWLEIIKTAAPVAIAGIAFAALRNWKRQDKAKREAEFLDALIEAAHAYIAAMAAPVTIVHIVKIAMDSHAPTWEGGDQSEKGATIYIQKYGEQDAKRLRETLETVRPITTRLRSLSAKGQVFKFPNYAKCQNAVTILTWQFDRAESLATMIGSTNLNWQNPEVRRALTSVMTIDADDIRKGMADASVAIIDFAREIYERTYG